MRNVTASAGWKGYAGGVGSILLGLALMLDVVADVPGIEGTFETAWAAIAFGLSVLGIRHRQDR